MKKTKLLSIMLITAALTACTADNTSGDREKYEEPEEQTAPVTDAEPETTPEAAPTEAAVETPTPTEAIAEGEEKSMFAIWEYSGYIDEAKEYLNQDEFINKDYDGDGAVDRVYREWDKDAQKALYKIEFGNGRQLIVPQGWETGFPHVQSGDISGDGEADILFTLSYDTSTDPMSFGEMWLFAYDKESDGYTEMELPLSDADDGSGGKCLDLEYAAPDGNTVGVSVKQNGFTASASLEDDYLNGYWLDDLTKNGYSEKRVVWSAEIKDEAIRCSVQAFYKYGDTIEFDLIYNGKGFDIKEMEYAPYNR